VRWRDSRTARGQARGLHLARRPELQVLVIPQSRTSQRVLIRSPRSGLNPPAEGIHLLTRFLNVTLLRGFSALPFGWGFVNNEAATFLSFRCPACGTSSRQFAATQRLSRFRN